MKKQLEKKKGLKNLMIMGTTLVMASPIYATGTPDFVTGTVKMATAASGWLALIIPVAAALFVGFHAWQKSMAEDDAVIAKHNKMIKNTIVGAIVATVAMSIVTTVLSFY